MCRDGIQLNIPEHKCCTDVLVHRMRINAALGKVAAQGVGVLTMTSSVWTESDEGRDGGISRQDTEGVGKLGL